MALLTNAPRGTQDVLPKESYIWQYVEKCCLEVAAAHGYKEIRFPTFEHTELFTRGVGDTTDVVEKEMYTFLDKAKRSITLRPEGTAGTVRAALQSGILNDALPVKAAYITSCFRYDKPQAGRLREFHQFGIENLGAQAPQTDVEIIEVANGLMKKLGMKDISLELNSIGCPKCRPAFDKALIDYLNQHKDKLCKECQDRLERNPLRVLDCKKEACQEIVKDAPVGLDYLCEECADHFEGVKTGLEAINIPFTVVPKTVRGLDYYTKTVFEFTSNALGAQSTVCGGGRYDGLVEILGGKPTPGIGFGMGIERLILILKAQNLLNIEDTTPDLYIASIGEAANLKALQLATELRTQGYWVEFDQMGRSLKSQMKYADKIDAKYSVVLGDDELQAEVCNLKNMQNGETVETSFKDIIEKLK